MFFRLLQHYKKLKFPSGQMENLKKLRKDLAEEKRKLEHNQEMLESLNVSVNFRMHKCQMLYVINM